MCRPHTNTGHRSGPRDRLDADQVPQAIWEEDEDRWISDAEVVEVEYTAFTGKAKKYRATARLLVRRLRRLNDAHVPDRQDELFKVWRFHAVFTDSPYALVEAERCHRAHAVVEQVFADLEDSAPGHLPVRLRKLAQKAVADELKANPDLPVATLATNPSVPWGIGTLWAIVKEYDVPPRQPNKAKRSDES